MVATTHPGELVPKNALEVDGLVYHDLKEKNLATRMDVFSKERCRELEKHDHLYSSNSLPLMLLKLRKGRKKSAAQKDREKKDELNRKGIAEPNPPVDRSYEARTKSSAQKDRIENDKLDRSRISESKPSVDRTYNHDLMHRSFCRLSDPTRSLNLTIFNYFYLSGDQRALNLLFDEKTLVDYGRTAEKVDIPSVLRMVAHRNWNAMRALSTNKEHLEIFKCQFCKKELKGHNANFENHIGSHEDIPLYCFVDGCDKYFKLYDSIRSHLQRTHRLQVTDLSAEQYHRLQSMKIAYRKKAAQYMDRYFPPESFIGFSDRKTIRAEELEDPKCADCGEIVRAGTSRRTHVASHLNLTYKCVIGGCERRINPTSITEHMNRLHSKKVSQLSVEELHQHKQNKLNFNKVMKEEVPKYFPRK